MPQSFEVSTDVEEYDLIDVVFYPLSVLAQTFKPPGAPVTWAVPQDKEFAVEHVTFRTDHRSRGQDLKSVMHFSFELFHDNLPLPPNHTHPQVHSIY